LFLGCPVASGFPTAAALVGRHVGEHLLGVGATADVAGLLAIVTHDSHAHRHLRAGTHVGAEPREKGSTLFRAREARLDRVQRKAARAERRCTPFCALVSAPAPQKFGRDGARGIDETSVNAFRIGSKAALALGGASLVACAANDDCRYLDTGRELCGTSATAKVVSSDGSPVVDARLNGKPVRLLIDTGAEMTVISSKFLGAPDRTVTAVDELCVGSLCLKKEPVYAWETPFSNAEGADSHGFVGMRTLTDFSLSLDHGTSVGLVFGASPCAGDSVPLTFTAQGTPLVSASADGQAAADTPVDTGSVYTLLGQSTVDALPPASVSPSTPSSLCTVDGCQDSGAFIASLPSYCVGSVCETGLDVKFPVFDAVGMSFLSQRTARFDFPDKQLTFCAE
jgi:hypothetical protein